MVKKLHRRPFRVKSIYRQGHQIQYHSRENQETSIVTTAVQDTQRHNTSAQNRRHLAKRGLAEYCARATSNQQSNETTTIPARKPPQPAERHTGSEKLLHPSKPLKLQRKPSKALTHALQRPQLEAAAQPVNTLLAPIQRAPQRNMHPAGSSDRETRRGRRRHRITA